MYPGRSHAQPSSMLHGEQARLSQVLLKHSEVQEANLRGITISSHISKWERTSICSVATAVYERALGGARHIRSMRRVPL